MSKKTKKAAAPTAPTGAVEGAAAADTQEVGAGPEASAAAGLLGSSVQPSVLTIGGKEIPLGDFVRAAFAATSLTALEWNELAADVREGLIADEIQALEAEAAAAEAEAKAAKAKDEAAAAAAAAAEAQAAAAAAEAEAAAAAKPAAKAYPRKITLRNNSGFDVTEPATRTLVSTGATVHTVVHDEAQAASVVQNAKAIEERTGGRQRLVVIGLDDVSIPETGETP